MKKIIFLSVFSATMTLSVNGMDVVLEGCASTPQRSMLRVSQDEPVDLEANVQELFALRGENEDLRQEIEGLRGEFEEKMQDYEKAVADAEESRRELEETHNEATRVAEEKKQAEGEIQSLQAQIGELTEQLAAKQSEGGDTEAVETLRRELAETSKALEEARALGTKKGQNARITKLQQELDEKKAELKEACETVEMMLHTPVSRADAATQPSISKPAQGSVRTLADIINALRYCEQVSREFEISTKNEVLRSIPEEVTNLISGGKFSHEEMMKAFENFRVPEIFASLVDVTHRLIEQNHGLERQLSETKADGLSFGDESFVSPVEGQGE